MIVADTNIISYLFLPTAYSEKASRIYLQDTDIVVIKDDVYSAEELKQQEKI